MGVSGGLKQGGGLNKVIPPNYFPSSFPSPRANFLMAFVLALICLESSVKGHIWYCMIIITFLGHLLFLYIKSAEFECYILSNFPDIGYACKKIPFLLNKMFSS